MYGQIDGGSVCIYIMLYGKGEERRHFVWGGEGRELGLLRLNEGCLSCDRRRMYVGTYVCMYVWMVTGPFWGIPSSILDEGREQYNEMRTVGVQSSGLILFIHC